MPPILRRKSATCTIGPVRVGSDAPVVVQSMTNTDTADIPGTVEKELSRLELGRRIKQGESVAITCGSRGFYFS